MQASARPKTRMSRAFVRRRASSLGGDKSVSTAAPKAVLANAVPAGPKPENSIVARADPSCTERIDNRSSAVGGKRPKAWARPNALTPGWRGDAEDTGSVKEDTGSVKTVSKAMDVSTSLPAPT